MNSKEKYEALFKEYPDVVDAVQLCEMLGGIGRKSAYKLLRADDIKHLKIGRKYCIPKMNVIQYVTGTAVIDEMEI